MAAPAAPANPYFLPSQPVLDFIVSGAEGASNGMWNSILNYYFKWSTYMIMPEFRHDNESRPDLLIIRTARLPTLETPTLIFEGKKSGGGSMPWDWLYSQAADYLKSFDGKLALVTMGRQADFITVVGAGDTRSVRTYTQDNGRVALKKQVQGFNTKLDVVNDVATIHQILGIVVVDQVPNIA